MGDRFNTGNLSRDIANLNEEVNRLKRLISIKQQTKQKNEDNYREKNMIQRTINKVNQLMSEGIRVKFERKTNPEYMIGYGLKRFNISLTIRRNRIYNKYDGIKHYSRNMEDDMRNYLYKGESLFGEIVSINPYEKQINVTREEYENAVNFLQTLLPINITIKLNEYDCIDYDTGNDFIWVNTVGDAYISGVSLTDR